LSDPPPLAPTSSVLIFFPGQLNATRASRLPSRPFFFLPEPTTLLLLVPSLRHTPACHQRSLLMCERCSAFSSRITSPLLLPLTRHSIFSKKTHQPPANHVFFPFPPHFPLRSPSYVHNVPHSVSYLHRILLSIF